MLVTGAGLAYIARAGAVRHCRTMTAREWRGVGTAHDAAEVERADHLCVTLLKRVRGVHRAASVVTATSGNGIAFLQQNPMLGVRHVVDDRPPSEFCSQMEALWQTCEVSSIWSYRRWC